MISFNIKGTATPEEKVDQDNSTASWLLDFDISTNDSDILFSPPALKVAGEPNAETESILPDLDTRANRLIKKALQADEELI